MGIVRMAFSRAAMTSAFGIPVTLFKAMLDLMPQDTTFVGCGFDGQNFLDYMFFSSSKFKEVKEGCIIPNIIPYFSRNPDGSAFIEKIEWNDTLIDNSCAHNWTTYKGLQNTYDYCTICSVRRNP